MSKLRVQAFTISIDGYGAGPEQSLSNPLGVGGEGLHGWLVRTRTFRKLSPKYKDDGVAPDTRDVDDEFAAQSFENVGAWIMGRNMFAPSRGAWTDDGWKGWWGENPPYHAPTFVLTHHARPPIEMKGGTTFHFVTDGIHAALKRAREAAGGKDIRLLGGVATLREYFRAGLVDEAHIAVAPVMLGAGENLFAGLDLPGLGYRIANSAHTDLARHLVIVRS
jgi:dihydrofolate reductase